MPRYCPCHFLAPPRFASSSCLILLTSVREKKWLTSCPSCRGKEGRLPQRGQGSKGATTRVDQILLLDQAGGSARADGLNGIIHTRVRSWGWSVEVHNQCGMDEMIPRTALTFWRILVGGSEALLRARDEEGWLCRAGGAMVSMSTSHLLSTESFERSITSQVGFPLPLLLLGVSLTTPGPCRRRG